MCLIQVQVYMQVYMQVIFIEKKLKKYLNTSSINF